jgi:hypothetical protein
VINDRLSLCSTFSSLQIMTDSTDTVTDLLASSKAKWNLAQSRLRRNEGELALLSLHGAIEDSIRAHLLRYRQPAGGAVWGAMLDAARADERQPLSTVEYERIQRLHTLRAKIARGDEITFTQDTLSNYYELAGQVLPRYGVQILRNESEAPLAGGEASRRSERLRPVRTSESRRRLALEEEEEASAGWQRYQRVVLPGLFIVAIFFIGVAISIGIQQLRTDESEPANVASNPTGERMTEQVSVPTVVISTMVPTPDLVLATAIPTAIPPNVLAVGRSATVRSDIEGLNVRAQPGSAATIPILFSLAPGSSVDIIEGPVTADNLIWWKVRAANQEGWCAGEFLEIR